MEYAFSLAGNRLVSVKDFLAMSGDHGQLIGRNQIVCAECRANVRFVKASVDGSRIAHFKHERFRENSEACRLRIGDYTQERVRRINENRQRYGIGYFQQRAEDYISLSVIRFLKRHSIKGFNVISSSPYDLDIEVFDVEGNEARILQHLRKKIATEVRMSGVDGRINPWLEGLRETLTWFIDKNPSLDYIRSEIFDTGIWGDFKNDVDESRLAYTIEIARHLKHSHTNKILLALKQASSYLATCALIHKVYKFMTETDPYRTASSVESQEVSPIIITADDLLSFCLNYPLGASVVDQYDHALDLDAGFGFLNLYTDEKEVNIALKNQSAHPFFMFDNSLDAAMNKADYGIHPMFRDHPIFKFISTISNPLSSRDYHNRYANIRCLLAVDLPTVLTDFYGDDAGSSAEIQLQSFDSKRGYIYIAYATGFNGFWRHELKALGRANCVKIGRSIDPERRKGEIAGNIAPPESIAIEGVFYVYDMKRGEKYIHQALHTHRLSDSREMFALDAQNAYNVVRDLVEEFNSSNLSISKKRKFKKGIGFAS